MSMTAFTEDHFKAIRAFLSGWTYEEAAEIAHLTKGKFKDFVQSAYQEGYIAIQAPYDHDLGVRLRDCGTIWRGGGPWVVRGQPDDRTFARGAAEKFLTLFSALVEDRGNELNIGIVSGSSTGSLVQALVESNLWDVVTAAVTIPEMTINVVSLNVTPVVGWELEGNANIATLRLAAMLRDKLPHCHVKPIGLSTTFVIPEADLAATDQQTANRSVLEIADPKRLRPEGGGPDGQPRLHLVITGVGSPNSSVFGEVLRDEGIAPPNEMVGDVGFWPVNKNGGEVKLLKDGEPHVIYSAISLPRLRELAHGRTSVMLIARNYRRGKTVDKTQAIRAAMKGEYVNQLFTDEVTAKQLVT